MTNLTYGGTVEQIAGLVQMKVLKPICDLLVAKDAKVIRALLDALNYGSDAIVPDIYMSNENMETNIVKPL